jgi:D-alanyl-D-alanine carboxypeptidase
MEWLLVLPNALNFNASTDTLMMTRRQLLMAAAMISAHLPLFAKNAFATDDAAKKLASVSEDRLRAMLQRWLDAFNSSNPADYRAFIAAYIPDGLPYIDDDLSIRDVSGGLQLIRSEVPAPNQIVGIVKDHSWDRFSKVMLTVESNDRLSDISFRGAPTPKDFTIARLSEDEALRGFQEKLQTEEKGGGFSGASLVAKGDRTPFRHAYGMANISQIAAATPETRFCIGSMGKMFTAVATLQLVQGGRLRLDAAVASYLPNYPTSALAKKVTVEQLLAHTGGTGDVFGPSYDGHAEVSPDKFIQLYGVRDLAFEPGSKWSYSNYGYVLLGAIIEKVSGKDYNAYFDEHIFRPAGMHSTSPTASSTGLVAIPYSGATATGLKPLAPYFGTPAGGGYSTIDDLLAFARAIPTKRLLDTKHTELFTIGKVDTGNGFYSLGLSVRSRNGEPCYGHGGSAPGVNGDLTIYPRSGYVTVVLCNRGYPLAQNASEYIGSRLPGQPG